jgi:hypothetical protein
MFPQWLNNGRQVVLTIWGHFSRSLGSDRNMLKRKLDRAPVTRDFGWRLERVLDLTNVSPSREAA